MNNLYDLEINKIAEIIEYEKECHSILRLSEMGIIPGAVVRIVKKTPFGGPIQLKIKNYYLAIRKEDALLIIAKELSYEK